MPISTLPEQSASCIVAKTAAGSHTLTIDGFSRIKDGNDRRTSIKSATFTVGGHSWYAECILHSDDRRGGPVAGWIFMLLRLACTDDDGEKVSASASYKFSLLDHNGQPSKSAGDGVCTFTNKMSSGVAFVDAKLLESRAATYLRGDCLRVRCDVTVYKAPRCEDRDVPSRLVAVPPPDMGEQLGRLLTSGIGADLTVQVAGEMFAVHRYILAVRSPVLLEEIVSVKRTEDDDMEAGVFKALLRYIYTDSLPEIGEGETTTDMAWRLIAAADRYGLDRLKLICEDMLCRRVDASSVVDTLAVAEQYNCRMVKKACVQFLMSGSNLRAAMAAGGFEYLRSSCPSVLKDLLAMVN